MVFPAPTGFRLSGLGWGDWQQIRKGENGSAADSTNALSRGSLACGQCSPAFDARRASIAGVERPERPGAAWAPRIEPFPGLGRLVVLFGQAEVAGVAAGPPLPIRPGATCTRSFPPVFACEIHYHAITLVLSCNVRAVQVVAHRPDLRTFVSQIGSPLSRLCGVTGDRTSIAPAARLRLALPASIQPCAWTTSQRGESLPPFA